MLARLRSWWRGRSRLERLLVAVGVPVAAIAALWSARQDRARQAAAGEDAEGGPGTEATTTAGVHTINTGAPGVATSDLASFTEVFAGEIGSLEDQLARLEKQFGDTPGERARNGDQSGDEIGLFPMPNPPVRLPDDAIQRPPENGGRKTDQNRLEHLRGAVRATGHQPGSVIDPSDVLAALRRIGRDPGSVADASDIAILQRWHANNS